MLNTSPGKFQTLWKVEEFALEQAERLQRTMAAEFGADQAVVDAARVLRIPNFYNQKYDPPNQVTAVKLSDQNYKPPDFRINLKLQPDQELHSRPAAQAATHAGGQHFSQSERDWADTLRRLGRGEDPAAVRAALEQKRQDKYAPNYYADRTVTRALAELERRRSSSTQTELEL